MRKAGQKRIMQEAMRSAAAIRSRINPARTCLSEARTSAKGSIAAVTKIVTTSIAAVKGRSKTAPIAVIVSAKHIAAAIKARAERTVIIILKARFTPPIIQQKNVSVNAKKPIISKMPF